MSLIDFAHVWQHSPAQATAFLVHLSLADRAVNGIVRATHAELGTDARCSLSSVARALQDLEAAGLIEVVKPKAGASPAVIHLRPLATRQNDVLPLTDAPQPAATAQIDGINEGQGGPTLTVMPPATRQIDVSGAPELVETDLPAFVKAVVMPQPTVPAPSVPLIPRAAAPKIGVATRDDVFAVMKALGIEPNPEVPLYWFRVEHRTDLADLLQRRGWAMPDLLAAIASSGVQRPAMKRMAEVFDVLEGIAP